jgi:salicylate hydroxylase
MAVEDGLVLAECISRASTPDEVPYYLLAYEEIRKERTSIIQRVSVKNMGVFGMEDGPQQCARDASRKAQTAKEQREMPKVKSNKDPKDPNSWGDKEFQPWLFGYNAIAEVLVLKNLIDLGKIETGQYVGKRRLVIIVWRCLFTRTYK